VKWKKRQREIKRLRAEHAGKRWRAPFPDLKTAKPGLAPCNNILDLYGSFQFPAKPTTNLVVDHFHKSGLQVVLPSEIKDMGGKKL
jgi:hypothetical protein